jgi:F-type H+-transporting ATPase subunit b
MAEPVNTTEGTEAPGGPGLPQMDFATYPSQIFWLVVTFVALLIVLSRVAIPRIGGAIAARRGRIEGDLSTAEQLRKDAANSLKSFESARAAARAKALALAEENRKRVMGDIEGLRNAADAQSQKALEEADARIAAARQSAIGNVRSAAADAASDIVERLIGQRVTPADAAKAVEG